jgi:hypothetical protein
MQLIERLTLVLATLGLAAGVAWAQVRPTPPRVERGDRIGMCLHEAPEAAAERQRRDDALAMVRLTDRLVGMLGGFPSLGRRSETYPTWEDLGAAGMRLGRMDGGPMGRLARQVQWGTREPLPGWQAHYVADGNGYALSLTDTRDPCGWTYFGDERGVVAQGYALGAHEGVVPVDSQ